MNEKPLISKEFYILENKDGSVEAFKSEEEVATTQLQNQKYNHLAGGKIYKVVVTEEYDVEPAKLIAKEADQDA